MSLKVKPTYLFVNNAVHSLSNSPSYFINKKVATLIVFIQFAAMVLMTKSLTRKQRNSFSFLVKSLTKRI